MWAMVGWAKGLRSVMDVLYQVFITLILGGNERMRLEGQAMEKTTF